MRRITPRIPDRRRGLLQRLATDRGSRNLDVFALHLEGILRQPQTDQLQHLAGELAYVFQGFLKTQDSGRMYIDARFAITHFSLPKGIDDANRITRDKSNQYLRNAEKTLESHPDQSFQPSLSVLRDVLATISTTAK